MIKSGYFDWVNNTKTPARITPVLIIISFDVKIMVAFMCASLLFDFCNRYRQTEFAINASIDTIIMV